MLTLFKSFDNYPAYLAGYYGRSCPLSMIFQVNLRGSEAISVGDRIYPSSLRVHHLAYHYED